MCRLSGLVVHPHCGWTGRFVRKGLEGRGRKTALQFCFWSLRSAQTPCLDSRLVSGVEFCLWQNSRSKYIMGPDSNSQIEFTFRLSKQIYDRNPRKARFFAEQKMRPNEAVNKSPPISEPVPKCGKRFGTGSKKMITPEPVPSIGQTPPAIATLSVCAIVWFAPQITRIRRFFAVFPGAHARYRHRIRQPRRKNAGFAATAWPSGHTSPTASFSRNFEAG
jgi:hypothetical protein